MFEICVKIKHVEIMSQKVTKTKTACITTLKDTNLKNTTQT